MNKDHWNKSSLKRHWFPDEKTLPSNGVEKIVDQALALYQKTAGIIETLSHPFWHEHPLKADGVLSIHCATCHTLIPLLRHLPPLFANVDDVVIAFFDEPKHHRDLEQAVRLYSFSLLLVLSGHIIREEQELVKYARYRLEELHGLSLLQKGQEGDDHFVTSEHEMQFLVNTFINVYKSLRDELDAWQTKHPQLSRSAFPATSASALHHERSVHNWPLLSASVLDKCIVSLPCYEWSLLALLLKESALHASFCPYLKEASLTGAPQWIPSNKPHTDSLGVTQPRLIWKGMVTMLLRISDHFADHGCDDVPFSQWLPDREMRRTLMRQYHDLNGDPEVYLEDEGQGKSYDTEHYGVLVWYIARRIEVQMAPCQ